MPIGHLPLDSMLVDWCHALHCSSTDQIGCQYKNKSKSAFIKICVRMNANFKTLSDSGSSEVSANSHILLFHSIINLLHHRDARPVTAMPAVILEIINICVVILSSLQCTWKVPDLEGADLPGFGFKPDLAPDSDSGSTDPPKQRPGPPAGPDALGTDAVTGAEH